VALPKKSTRRNWHIGWRGEDGKVRSRSAATTDRAIAKRRGVKYERDRFEAEAHAPAYKLTDALDDLVAHKKRSKRSAATIEITECKCGHLRRVLGDDFDVAKTTLADSNMYVDQRRAEGAHDHTITKELGQLKQALRLARRATPPRFERDPSTIWPKEALENAYVPRDTYWTLEDYRTAQYHGIESRADHVAIYCNTGVRYRELYRLEAKHVDLELSRIYVAGTKTKSAKRWAPLNAIALEVIQRRVALYPTGPLFPDRWSRSRLVQDMRRVAKRAGVPAVSANDFRRTFATWCGEAGVDESTVVSWMGHTSSKMVRRVYQQLSVRRASSEGAKLSAFVAATPAATHTNSASPAGFEPDLRACRQPQACRGLAKDSRIISVRSTPSGLLRDGPCRP
jgi:integrase